MANLEDISSEQRQQIEETVALVLATQKEVADSPEGYEPAGVTGTLATGAACGMHGNIHYTRGGQIYLYLEGEPGSCFGPFAGDFNTPPLIGALSANRLAGKTGTFEASGWGWGGRIQMWIDGQPVFSQSLEVRGTPGPWAWKLEGKVRFERR